MPKRPSPPSHLSKEAAEQWIALTGEYDITDPAGLLLLQTSLEAFDRMREAQGLIAKHGAVTFDNKNQLRTNPATVIERDSRASVLAALKMLNLDVEPLRDRPGRPGGK